MLLLSLPPSRLFGSPPLPQKSILQLQPVMSVSLVSISLLRRDERFDIPSGSILSRLSRFRGWVKGSPWPIQYRLIEFAGSLVTSLPNSVGSMALLQT